MDGNPTTAGSYPTQAQLFSMLTVELASSKHNFNILSFNSVFGWGYDVIQQPIMMF